MVVKTVTTTSRFKIMKTYPLLSRLLLILAGVFALTACSSEDDLPDADISVTYSGAVEEDDVLYVARGTDLSIDALTVTSTDGSRKATLGAASYYWNYQFVGTVIAEPFGMMFDTAALPAGAYVLQINSTVWQEGKSVGMAYITFIVKIVEADPSQPATASTLTGTVTPDSDIRAGALPTR